MDDTPEPSPRTFRKQQAELYHRGNQAAQSDGLPLLPGELPCFTISQITLQDPFHGTIQGLLHATNYKLLFNEDPSNKEMDNFHLEIPMGVISNIEKIGKAKKKDGIYGVEIHCKDMRSVKFILNQDDLSRRAITEKMQILAFPLNSGGLKTLFAFHFCEDYPESGWEVYNPKAEYERMGVGTEDIPWRFTTLNEKYDLCETYPSVLVVPKAIDDANVELASKFRSRNRLPVLSWLDTVTLASITRCSQPLVGPRSKRSQEDENYIQEIVRSNSNSNKVYIADARPKINALVNIAMGGGYEHDDWYSNIEFSFMDIGNIHVMRESLRQLKEMVFPLVDDVRFLSNLENTRWLDHIKTILSGAVRIAEIIEKRKSSVLIHCTDGWDRTAQLSSLAMLMLDPHYRTIKGFEILLEKEWLSFGHKFNQRIGHGDRNHSDDQRSPIFVQFIDCVWQMTRQFPCEFEFNELFLITILDHLYSCLFGTFLCNSEKARTEAKVKEETISLWSFMNSQKPLYTNPLYSEKMHQQVFYPLTGIRHLSFWTGYYIRWNPRMRPQEVELERHRQLQSIISQLKEYYEELQEEIKAKKLENDENL